VSILLLGMGCDELSVACPDLPRVKAAIRSVPASLARGVAAEALAMGSAAEVRALLMERIAPVLPEVLHADGEDA
jgi:phosphocarrier protein FPr